MENIVHNMHTEDKIGRDATLDWLFEGMYERYPTQLTAFCERKGFTCPAAS
jgi:hypothetical protein